MLQVLWQRSRHMCGSVYIVVFTFLVVALRRPASSFCFSQLLNTVCDDGHGQDWEGLYVKCAVPLLLLSHFLSHPLHPHTLRLACTTCTFTLEIRLIGTQKHAV